MIYMDRGGVKWCTKTESQKAFRPMNGRIYTRNRCFCCGRLLRGQNSREHVFPKWLQEKFNLWDLAAENIPADILIDLVRGGLAVARNERLEDEDGAVDVTRMWITEAGELALAASRI